jgi:hypothetical protein
MRPSVPYPRDDMLAGQPAGPELDRAYRWRAVDMADRVAWRKR